MSEDKDISPEPQLDGTSSGDENGQPPLPFFPDFALVEAITAFAFLVVLVIIASITSPSLEQAADPAASGYIPRPEWYFMWVFQLLKYFKGKSEVLGTFVLPVIVIGLLVSLPFIDRHERTRSLLPRTRPVRLWPRVGAAVTITVIASLTFSAMASPTPMTNEGSKLTPVEVSGQALYQRLGCSSCHTISGVGGTRGPELTSFGLNPDADQRVLLHFAGVRQAPGSVMPGYQLSDAELSSLAAYLLSLQEKGQP